MLFVTGTRARAWGRVGLNKRMPSKKSTEILGNLLPVHGKDRMGAAMWGKFDEVVHTMFIKTVNECVRLLESVPISSLMRTDMLARACCLQPDIRTRCSAVSGHG